MWQTPQWVAFYVVPQLKVCWFAVDNAKFVATPPSAMVVLLSVIRFDTRKFKNRKKQATKHFKNKAFVTNILFSSFLMCFHVFSLISEKNLLTSWIICCTLPCKIVVLHSHLGSCVCSSRGSSGLKGSEEKRNSWWYLLSQLFSAHIHMKNGKNERKRSELMMLEWTRCSLIYKHPAARHSTMIFYAWTRPENIASWIL